MKWKISLILVLLCSCLLEGKAQRIAVKTNILYDAAATINIGAELGVAPKWTIDVSGNYNNWNMSHERRWKHWFVQPEARYWFCERFGGHFVGVHAIGGKFNIGNLDNDFKFLGTNFSVLSDQRFQGWAVGGGLAYGYSYMLNEHWNLEAELGLGYAYMKYDRYPCAVCGDKIAEDQSHNYWGVTKLAINLVYLF